MMSRIEMMPSTSPSETTTRWRKPPRAIASAASSNPQSPSANVAFAVRWSPTVSVSGSSPAPSDRTRSRSVMMPGPGCSGSMITAAPTLCSDRKRAASRSVRPGVIVRTSSVIASRTFVTPAALRPSRDALRQDRIRPRGRGSARTYRPVGDGVACGDATQRSAVSGGPPAIRAATAADIADVLDLWSQARSANALTPDTHDALEALLDASPGALLVAQHETDGIVGALIAARDGWRGNMYRLAVHPRRRREGIARSMVEHGERHLRSKGARRMTALVAHEEVEAVRFWTEALYARDTTIARFVKQLGD